MRIALEATAACRPKRSGVGVYVLRLVDALLRRAAPAGDDIALGCRLSRWKHRHLRHSPPGASQFWIQEPLWPLHRPFDVVHGLDARVPNWPRALRVATLHDLATLLIPEISSPRFQEKIRGAYRQLAATADLIISDSESTRQDFLRLFEFPPEAVEVVHLGVDSQFHPRESEDTAAILTQYGLEQGYIFYAGEISQRKNSAKLLEGYAASKAAGDIPLVLAGAVSWGGEDILAGLSRLGIENNVRLLGYVPDDHLPCLYAGAAAFLYPTRYEGFGMPVLDAMASGIPVVGGNRGSVPEIAGGHAALVDPDDPGHIAAGLDRALQATSEEREAARRHANGFTWDGCADKTRAAYANALKRR